jgi:hypothetical protein
MSSGFKLAQDLILITVGALILIFHNWILDYQEKFSGMRKTNIRARNIRDKVLFWIGVFWIMIGFFALAKHYQ